MTWYGTRARDVKLRDVVSKILSTNEVSRIDRNYMTVCVLSHCFHIYKMVNLFVFLGNWDILTLLVMADIVFFIVVTVCGLNVMYGVIFLLVIDLVICIYVIYL